MSHHFQHDGQGRLGKIIISEEDLQERVKELGEQITRDYEGREPLLITVLKGASIFMADLARAIRLPIELDFMAVSSYGAATKTSGVVRIIKDLDIDLHGRDVIIVEDVIDSGLTLNYLRRTLEARQPASLEVCSLTVKEGAQRVAPNFRYVGFKIPTDFIVGYGLDVAEKYRNLPYICMYEEKAGDQQSLVLDDVAAASTPAEPTRPVSSEG